MSLFEDLEREAEKLRVITPGCKTCEWLETLESKDRLITEITNWYEDKLPHLNLWRILRNYGLPASDTSLRRHRDQCVFKVAPNVN